MAFIFLLIATMIGQVCLSKDGILSIQLLPDVLVFSLDLLLITLELSPSHYRLTLFIEEILQEDAVSLLLYQTRLIQVHNREDTLPTSHKAKLPGNRSQLRKNVHSVLIFPDSYIPDYHKRNIFFLLSVWQVQNQ